METNTPKKHFLSSKTFAGAGRGGAARAGALALELVSVCSQAPPFLEACSGDVLGSRPVARRGRGSWETRCSGACCALPSPRSRLPKAKEEAAEPESVAVDKLKPPCLVEAPIVGAATRFSNPELLMERCLSSRRCRSGVGTLGDEEG